MRLQAMQKRPKDLTASAVRVYQSNKKKWNWDKTRPKIEELILIQSEIFEAMEAIRKHKTFIDSDHVSVLTSHIDKITTLGKCTPKEVKDYKIRYHNYYSNFVKHSLQDEIADIIIRLLSYAGGRKIELEYLNEEYVAAKKNIDDFLEIVQDLFSAIAFLFKMAIGTKELSDLIGYLVAFAHYNKIDVWLHVDLKLFYNLVGPAPQKKF